MTEADLRKQLAAFSQRAQGHKVPDPPNGSPAPDSDAISSLEGPVAVDKGIARSPDLRFQVPGAKARLSGTFNFENRAVHLTGKLATQAELSGDTTGFKSILLKPLDPFFKKHKHGAVIPIARHRHAGPLQGDGRHHALQMSVLMNLALQPASTSP